MPRRTSNRRYDYSPHERFVVINQDDPDLAPIRIDVLDLIQRTYKAYNQEPPEKLPPATMIDGYGMRPEDQYFRRLKIPDRLQDVESWARRNTPRGKKESYTKYENSVIDTFWAFLEDNRSEYRDEIIFIDRMWYHRLFGYWFYNNGTPTYMTGTNFFYLHFYDLENMGHPDYRDRDRRWYIFQEFCMRDTLTFEKLDHNGKAIPNENGSYDMIDIGRRICHGSINTKARRAGDTSKASCINIEQVTRTVDASHGIQGKDDDNATNVFNNHVVHGYRRMPIFFRPNVEKIDPKNVLNFTHEDPQFEMNSRINFATSADRGFYDNYGLDLYHADEPGKVVNESVAERHEVVKLSCSIGAKIRGFMIYTTTVEEMEGGGGDEFLKLCKKSMWNQRTENGQTMSGMYLGFFRASDGMQDYIDKYGMSVEDTPTPEQAKYIGSQIGARQYLENKRKALVRKKDWNGLASEKRRMPLKYREIFTPSAKQTFFRNDILEKRLNDLAFDGDRLVRKGNLHWKGNKFGPVYWEDDDDGLFEISTKLDEKTEANRFIIRDGYKQPEFPGRFVLGADPFRLERERAGGSKMSDGGLAIFYKRDYRYDTDDRDVKDWTSNRFVLTYKHRHDTPEEYVEDVAKAAIYFGAMVYPEMNVEIVDKKFREWNLDGYLLYDFDKNTGEFKNSPGWTSVTKPKTKIFNLWKSYIAVHGKRERHASLLQECLDIDGYEKMTDYDLFTAGGGALMGAESDMVEHLEAGNIEIEPEDLLDTYTY